MSVHFDHLLVAVRNKQQSAQFFAAAFNLPEPQESGFFTAVTLSDGAVINFVNAPPQAEILGQHYAFLVDDATFDVLLKYLKEQNILYWADPQMQKPHQINTNQGGRGVYFNDPDGHHLEALTRREGTGMH